MLSDLHRSRVFSRGLSSRAVLAWGASALLLVGLAACSSDEVTSEPPAPATPAPSGASTEAVEPEAEQAVDASMQPEAGATAIEAAEQLTQIHLSLLRAGEFDEACLLYLPGFEQQLLQLIGSSSACPTALKEGFVDSVAEAAEASELTPITPAFFLPAAIEIDTAQLTADSDTLAYVPSSAVRSLDQTSFRDGVGVAPIWLARSFYVQQDDHGVWRFAAASDREL